MCRPTVGNKQDSRFEHFKLNRWINSIIHGRTNSIMLTHSVNTIRPISINLSHHLHVPVPALTNDGQNIRVSYAKVIGLNKDAVRWTRTEDLQKLNPTSKTGSEINKKPPGGEERQFRCLLYSGAYAWCGLSACGLDCSAYGLATSVFTQLWAWPSNLCIESLQKLLYQIWAKVKNICKFMQIR